ncbi:MAG TPA: septal ring lytic transglycosylase RlpA family protein [Devosia sp.]|nr:septal ring lytic transglycosylase RlpA family protein [Devosia sp.]
MPTLPTKSAFPRKFVRLAALSLFLAPLVVACGSGSIGDSGVKRNAFTSKEFGVAVSPRMSKAKFPPRGGGREMPLKPYKVAGKTYTPVAGPGYVERGRASWYGQDFHGRQTANGEIFGAYYLTAASPVLPIPSYARVTNLENGRSVLVRVNDRGPYLQGRVMDLSFEAANALGYVNSGHAEVEVRYVSAAPLNGDDTRMLMASLNTRSPLEQQIDSMSGGNFAVADAQLAPIPANLFSYATDGPVSGAAAATAAMASGQLAGPELRNDEGDVLTLRLGVFRDAKQVRKVTEAFAMLGAVDETSTGDKATVLTLIRLKAGVSREDVLDLAQELGLNDIILY